MAFSVIVSPRAQKEIETAIDFYALNSADAPANFISELKDVYELLQYIHFIELGIKTSELLP